MTDGHPYKPVRALHRGLAILQELNRIGSARPAELATAAGIDRTTVYRLLATLVDAGLARENSDTGGYVLTEHVRTLSEGFTERDRLTQLAAPILGRLFHKVVWPTDLATFDRGAMVIRETTHRFSPYSVHRAMIGQPRPLLTSALGRAALVGATDAERATMLEIARGHDKLGGVATHRLDDLMAYLDDEYGKRGYAFSVGGSEARISAIAVPVATNFGTAAAVNVVFFSSAMSVERAAERFLAPLKQCVTDIEGALAGQTGTQATGHKKSSVS